MAPALFVSRGEPVHIAMCDTGTARAAQMAFCETHGFSGTAATDETGRSRLCYGMTGSCQPKAFRSFRQWPAGPNRTGGSREKHLSSGMTGIRRVAARPVGSTRTAGLTRTRHFRGRFPVHLSVREESDLLKLRRRR